MRHVCLLAVATYMVAILFVPPFYYGGSKWTNNSLPLRAQLDLCNFCTSTVIGAGAPLGISNTVK